MQCDYFDRGVCRSCTHMGEPYASQLAAKDARTRALLVGARGAERTEWMPPVASPEEGYRNKAKMVVGGTAQAPTFGILDESGRGVDLRHCGITAPGIRAALPVIARFTTLVGLEPYDVPTRRGELKHVLVTEAPGGELMVRLVLRSTADLARIRKHLPSLLEALPRAVVVTANIHPEHRALLEGEREIVLTEADTLRMPLDEVALHLRPQSFFQTNTAIATALYREAREWTSAIDAASVWDLYCGVGGFALHLARPGREVLGVELSAEAVESARQSVAEAGIEGVRFEAGDATAFALGAAAPPELVVVNPPRRGIGPALADWIEASGVRHVLYSSCEPASLARDLERMPSMALRRARVLDMFPQIAHLEVLTLLEREDARAS